MKGNLWSLACSGLLAIGIALSAAAPTTAAPLAPINVPVKAETSPSVEPVSRRCRNGRCFDRHHWRGDRYAWRHHRRHHRRHFGRNYGPGIVLGFGLGLPAYNYYAQPRYYPRRHYRSYGGSNAHVRWCYNRYRSYQAYDNTFQPYGGPRRLCWSPYS